MNGKIRLDGNSILLALAGIVALAVGVGQVTVSADPMYGPPSMPPMNPIQPFQPIDVTHTTDQMNSMIPNPVMTVGGVMQSDKFPSMDNLKGSLDFLLVQPQCGDDVFTKTSAYVANLTNGTLLCSVKKPSETGVVVTAIGDVAFTSNSDAFVVFDSANNVLRVRNVTGLSQRVKVKINKGPLAGKIFLVEPGFELVVSDHDLSRGSLRPADGITRRGSRLIDGKYAAVSEYYVQSQLQSSALVSQMEQKQASDAKARRILTDMSRMAAVLNQVNGGQGFGH
jgi:hypothetical protein